jgi:hypothetical protein
VSSGTTDSTQLAHLWRRIGAPAFRPSGVDRARSARSTQYGRSSPAAGNASVETLPTAGVLASIGALPTPYTRSPPKFATHGQVETEDARHLLAREPACRERAGR